jgi:BTB/POZ domain
MMTSPFNDHRADVILRTSDLVDFRVHTLVLSLVSPVFDSMFNLPQPPDAEDALPVISVSESSRTLEKFLGFCYPGRDPELADLNDVGDMLEVMSKYDVEAVKNRVRKSLLAPIFLETEPLRVFAIAQLYHLEFETKRAALYTLRRPQFEVYCAELERISARPYHRLAKYGAKCRTAAARVATVPNSDWITVRFAWFSCRKNPSPDGEFRISNSTGKVDRKHREGWFSISSPDAEFRISNSTGKEHRDWWLTYMRAVSVALADIPWFNTPKISQEIDIAMNKALACDTCRENIISEMRTFNQLLAAEVERVVTEVSQICYFFLSHTIILHCFQVRLEVRF